MNAYSAHFPFLVTVWDLLPRKWSLQSERVFPYQLMTIKIIPHRHAQRAAFQDLQIIPNWQFTFSFYEPAFVFSFIKFGQDQRTWRIPLRVKRKGSVWGWYSIWLAIGAHLRPHSRLSVLTVEFFVCQWSGHLLLAIGPGNFFKKTPSRILHPLITKSNTVCLVLHTHYSTFHLYIFALFIPLSLWLYLT